MEVRPIEELRANGRMRWIEDQRAWGAAPDDVVSALTDSGFREYKREEARGRRDRQATGGMWQGIDTATGAVASAVWVNRPGEDAIVYIDIDGEPLGA
jgi:hypothetical protein